LVNPVCDALAAAGIEYGRATRRGFDQQVTVVAVGMVKGLEVDSAIVVEPARIVSEEAQGMRALYVALTRATKRLTVVYAEPLPAVLAE
jgi:DNA helicase IV